MNYGVIIQLLTDIDNIAVSDSGSGGVPLEGTRDAKDESTR